MAHRNRRIAKEIEECQNSQESIQVQAVGDDLSHLKGSFRGPDGTPYEGGNFQVDIQVPNDYPFRPPKMKFDTKLYHPNVSSQTGAICLDILKEQWSPVFTMRSSLISLQSMLHDPQPNDPQDAEVASHYLRDRKSFEETARYWTKQYASKTMDLTKEDPLRLYGFDVTFVSFLTDMGFPQARVIEVGRRLGVKTQQDAYKLDGGMDRFIGELTL